jgi:hypothetical protein
MLSSSLFPSISLAGFAKALVKKRRENGRKGEREKGGGKGEKERKGEREKGEKKGYIK